MSSEGDEKKVLFIMFVCGRLPQVDIMATIGKSINREGRAFLLEASLNSLYLARSEHRI